MRCMSRRAVFRGMVGLSDALVANRKEPTMQNAEPG